LEISSINIEQEPDQIKKCVQAEVDDYQADKGAKPEYVRIKNLGTLAVKGDLPQSDLPLQNKVALVTGAAGAIGYGICQVLLKNGCLLAAGDLPGQKLDDFVADLNKTYPGRVIGLGMDVTQESSVEKGFQQIIRTWGGIDIVIVNAGIALVCNLKDMDLEAFRKLEKVNVEGTLLTIKLSSRSFLLQGIGGDIVVISTKNVPSPGASFGAYSATKAAAHQLGRIASLELAQYGVRVNFVAPDAVFSEGRSGSGT
jgi:NAD(P)-dependent dehydrogenase (short-subunit alcohol dehydrogenase family)